MGNRICSSCKAKSLGDERFCLECGEVMITAESGDRSVRRLDLARLRPSQPQLILASAVINADVSPGASPSGGSNPPMNALTPVGASAMIVPAVSVRRSRWVKRPWYKRPRVLVPLIVMTLGLFAVGAIVYNIQRTFSTINQVSTPASQVSGAALGGDESITIDTGPAQAALAAASQTAAAGGVASSAPTDTPVPTEAAPTTEPTAPANESSSNSTGLGQLPPPPSGSTDANATDDSTAEPEATSDSADQQVAPMESNSASSEGTTPDATEPVARQEATEATEASTVAPPPSSNTVTAVPTDAPSATSTSEPTAEPTMTDVPPTETPPSPTPIMSEIERVKNGDFEAGDSAWYVEANAAITETDAVSGSQALVISADGSWVDQSFFFLQGTTYQLSTWGKLTEQGDKGVIGISYFDADGSRLNDLEPKPLNFTKTSYTEETLQFTVPKGVETAKVFIWKEAGKAEFHVDDLSLRSEIQPSDLQPAQAAADDDAITILVMGVDARPGEAIDIGVRPDSLMILRLNPKTGSCRTLAIPRDTRTELPGYGQSKINHALAVGGIPYEQQVVENLTGLKIDHYLLIDFNGFQDLVDAVGGIQIDVPEAFTVSDDMWFEAGPQTMDGQHALAYARWRGGSDGDFGRINRQQQVLRSLIRKGAGLDVIRSLNELLPAVQDNIRTDLGATDMARLGLDYRETCTDQSVEMLRLEGYDAWFDDPLLNLRLIYVVVDEAEVSSKVRMLVEQ